MEQGSTTNQQNTFNKRSVVVLVLSVLAAVLITGLLSYYIFGRIHQNSNSSTVKEPMVQEQTSEVDQMSDIGEEFVEASYRVIALRQDSSAPYSLIVATERSEAKCGTEDNRQRCTNDTSCGSIYSSPHCYFFVEPLRGHPIDPATRFVGKWKSDSFAGVDGLVVDSIKFIDQKTIQFESSGGDSGLIIRTVWTLDLESGDFTKQSNEESRAGELQ